MRPQVYQMDILRIKKRILIVDDEAFNIVAMKLVLESIFNLNHTDLFCDEAFNGQIALNKVKQNVEENGG